MTASGGSTKRLYTLKVLRDVATPNWVQLVEEGPFPIRDSAGQLVFNGRMWLLGGYLPELSDDVWSSVDGIDWKFEGNIGAADGINIPVHFAYRDRMWVSSAEGKLFSSADGKNWELVNEAPPWAGRYAAGSVTFAGKMWVLGGMRDKVLYNDIWCSEDGIHWEHICEQAEWSPRQLFDNVVVKDDKLWIIGGGITSYEPFRAYRDVWCSSDGVHWEQVTASAPWPARTWSNCVVYRNRIVLLGGFRAQPTWQNFGDVWYTENGRDWRQLTIENCWSARHELSPYVFEGKLWVVAGNPWPLVNDVWQLEIKGLTFLSQPVVEEYANALYSYQACADFNAGGGMVRYRLAEAPAWLQVDADTGLVSGITKEMGDYPIIVEAYDDAGETMRQSYALHVFSL